MVATTARTVRQWNGKRTVSAQDARSPPAATPPLSRCARVRHHVSPSPRSHSSCARRPPLIPDHPHGDCACHCASRTRAGCWQRDERGRCRRTPGYQRAGDRWSECLRRICRDLQPVCRRSSTRGARADLRQRQWCDGDPQGCLGGRRSLSPARCALAGRQLGGAVWPDRRHDLRERSGGDRRQRRAAYPGRHDRDRRGGLGYVDEHLARRDACARSACGIEPGAFARWLGRIGAGHQRQHRRFRDAYGS